MSKYSKKNIHRKHEIKTHIPFCDSSQCSSSTLSENCCKMCKACKVRESKRKKHEIYITELVEKKPKNKILLQKIDKSRKSSVQNKNKSRKSPEQKNSSNKIHNSCAICGGKKYTRSLSDSFISILA